MSELKPCPFCGGDAHPMAQHWDDGSHVWWVECKACGAEGKRCDGGMEAIDAWNTRAERTCHVVPHGYCIANGEESCCRCWSCSECSYGWHVSDYDRQYRYCPNCGARVVE